MNNFIKHELNEKILGWSLKRKNSFFFFSTKNLTEAELNKHFPRFNFKKNKQVHSNIVIPSERSPQNADGLWSCQNQEALIAVTADCMPVLLSNGQKVLALHAGWRGVASDIVGAAFHSLTDNEKKSTWVICLGPYIQKDSFIIKADALDLLIKAWEKVSQAASPAEQIDSEHWTFDLHSLLLAQIRFYFRENFEFYHLDFDTKRNSLFHSYRRDKVNTGRNYSFVALEG